jgi:hypothetical protein
MERLRTGAVNLTIDRLSLRLPAGFEHRADTIARGVGDELARLPWPGGCHLDNLQIAPQTVQPEQSNHQIAAQIARAIHSRITEGKG